MHGLPIRRLISLLFLLPFPVHAFSSDAVLTPGYIAGTVTVGDYRVDSISISATSGNFSASNTPQGSTYHLTVKADTTPWNYTVNSAAFIRTQGVAYPYTRMGFNSRTLRVTTGETVRNDYQVAPATLRVHLTLQGNHATWSANVTASGYSPGKEATNSWSFTRKAESPEGVWDIPVVPNSGISVESTIIVDDTSYPFNKSGIAVAPGETVDLFINILHDKAPPAKATVQGTIHLNKNIEDFKYHRLTSHPALQHAQTNTNPGFYQIRNVDLGTEYVRPISYWGSPGSLMEWPRRYWGYIRPSAGEVINLDFLADDLGTLISDVRLTGTIAQRGVTEKGVQATGGSTSSSGGNSRVRSTSGPVKLHLPPGVWDTEHLFFTSSTSKGTAATSIYDYRFSKRPYNNYAGQQVEIVPGATVYQDRDYCTGAHTVRFRISGGGLLSNPRVYGWSSHLNENGKLELETSVTGYRDVSQALSPEVDIHGPAGTYTLRAIARTADGSYVDFARLTTDLECGVSKGGDLSGPRLQVTSPPSTATNRDSVTVGGTASDDTGITAISVNGASVPFVPTGGGGNEVAFSFPLPVADGQVRILTKATDTIGNEAFDDRTVCVDRRAPAVQILSPQDGAVHPPGTSIPVSVQAFDRGCGFTVKVYRDAEVLCEASGRGSFMADESAGCGAALVTTAADQTITAVATDLAGNATTTAVILRGNQPPAVEAGGPYTVAEGSSVTLTAVGHDPERGELAYAWDLDGDGVFETPGRNVSFSATSLDGPDSRTVAMQATDDGGLTAAAQATVDVLNAAPEVGAIPSPLAPVAANTTVTVSAPFTDPGVLDTHTAVWNWGDGNASAGAVAEEGGAGTVTGQHVYTTPGVYTVILTVTDKDEGFGKSFFRYLVVYDPAAGFVTGGGWLTSPAGASASHISSTGKANFGFVAKYHNGEVIPSGQTEFNFPPGTLNFHSTGYEWLAVAGGRAKLQGTGRVNGQGDYGFMMTAVDGKVDGASDTFRMKIWDRTTGAVVYDNRTDVPDDAYEGTALGGGNIVIHEK